MFKFQIIPTSQLPQKKTRTILPEQSLDEKFDELRKRIWRTEGRKLREFHFLAIEHEGFLIVLNGNRKEFARIEILNKHKAIIQARLIYVEAIKGNEETNGGCYFDTL